MASEKAMEEGISSDQGVTRRAGAGGESASIESARRFLYDEDEPAAAAKMPATSNIPLPPTSLKEKKRVNPIVAACLSTCNTCRGYGLKRLCLALFFIGFVVLLAFGITSLAKTEKEHVRTKHVNKIAAQLEKSGISTKDQLATPGTPQNHALNWLANVDRAKAGSPFLEQRYALAVFFYSTSTDYSHIRPESDWRDQESWMTKKGICIWYGVECQAAEEGPRFDGNAAVTALKLADNKVGGSLPSELSALTDLVTLDLSQNALTGSLPKSLSTIKSLRYLMLRDNGLKGAIPKDFANFENLRELHLGQNELEGKIPNEIEHIATLKALGLESNQFVGTIPGLTDLESLNILYLDNNKLTGEFPTSITKLHSLVEITIYNNHITGKLPDEIEELTKLEKFHLSRNNFQGTIPGGFYSKATRLTEFIVSYNEFEGTIPKNLNKLRDMAIFDLSSNKFHGTIPDQLFLMADLKQLILSDNNFNGPIPGNVGSAKDLEQLRLQRNKMDGTLPVGIGLLHKLEDLDLDSNKFEGSVPTYIGAVKSLKNMRVYQNSLTGAMPAEVCELKEENLEYLAADCSSGNITCDCCHKCF